MEAIEVFGINATVYTDVTPSGNHKNTIKIHVDSDIAIDRVHEASDYRSPKHTNNMQLKDRVYTNGREYIAYAIHHRSNNSIFLITARCSDRNLDYDASLKQISKAMDKAFEYMINIQTL